MISKLGELFNITWGQKEYHSKESIEGLDGNVLLISSKGEDNGAYGFFDIPVKYRAPFITVPSTGTIGQAFVQIYDCCVNDDVLILYPKNNMTIEELYQVAYQIRKNKWKYTYGRKITPKRLAEQKISIVKTAIDYQKFTEGLTPKKVQKKKIMPRKSVRLVKVSDLCTITKKQGIPLNKSNLNGKVPYISSSSKDNGAVAFVDEEPNAEAKSLTVAKDGNDGYSFFQPLRFITSHHNYILRPKNNYPTYLLFYIGAVIRKRCYCYNHYYPLSKKHLERLEIPMPIDENGKYDFAYIEELVRNCFGYEELKAYIRNNESGRK